MADDKAGWKRLPLWARQRIEMAEASLADAERRLKEMVPDSEGGLPEVELDPYGEAPRRLPGDSWVRFWCVRENGSRSFVEVTQVTWRGNEGLKVRGEQTLLMRPEAANSCVVEWQQR